MQSKKTAEQKAKQLADVVDGTTDSEVVRAAELGEADSFSFAEAIETFTATRLSAERRVCSFAVAFGL